MHRIEQTPSITPSDIRLRLIANGYKPIPVNGKRPRISGWSKIVASPAAVAAWERGHADHQNTGVLAGDVVAIDIDALDADVAAKLKELVAGLPDGDRALCRVGRAPKALYVFRALEPREKAATPVYLVGGQKCQVEVLGRGQQFVGFGLHPETGQPYEWIGRSPLDVPFSELPIIEPDDLDRLLVAAEGILSEFGEPEKKQASDRKHAQTGESFWQKVNSAALASPENWVLDLFPGAKREVGTGAWRVTSKDLGRPLQEDISIHPDGIRDFGREEPETAINLVIEYGGAATTKEAAFWLCDRLRIDPTELGWQLSQSAPPVSLNPASKKASATAANDNTPPKGLNIFDWKSSRFVGEPPSIDYLIQGILPLGVPAMLAAMGDTGKSYVMLEIGRRVGFGEGQFATPILGGNIRTSGTAVILTSEDDEGEVHRRIAALDKKSDRLTRGDKLIVVPLPSAGGALPFWRQSRDRGLEETPEFRKFADQLMTITDLRFVGIDPLASFAHLPINEDPAAGQFVCTSLGRLASETKATVAAAHHMRKASKPVETLAEARDAIRGSTALVDGLRLAYALWPAEAERAKRICKTIGRPYAPNAIAFGGVVKANGAAKRILSTYHRNEFGLLVDVTGLAAGEVGTSQDDLLTALIVAIEGAAAAGSPFSKSGAAGVFEMRETLPDDLRGLSKGRLHALVDEALERGQVVKTAARNEKTKKWLDVPTGVFAAGLGEFRAGMTRAA